MRPLFKLIVALKDGTIFTHYGPEDECREMIAGFLINDNLISVYIYKTHK